MIFTFYIKIKYKYKGIIKYYKHPYEHILLNIKNEFAIPK